MVARYLVENNQNPSNKFVFDENAKSENLIIKCILKRIIGKIKFLTDREEKYCLKTLSKQIKSCYDGLRLSLRQKI